MIIPFSISEGWISMTVWEKSGKCIAKKTRFLEIIHKGPSFRPINWIICGRSGISYNILQQVNIFIFLWISTAIYRQGHEVFRNIWGMDSPLAPPVFGTFSRLFIFSTSNWSSSKDVLENVSPSSSRRSEKSFGSI